MIIKTNYFLRNMVDLGIATIGEYLKSADQNYVILVNGKPIVWGDKTPVVCGDEASLQNELSEMQGMDDDGALKEGWQVLTEFDFLVKFCKDALLMEIFKDMSDRDFAEFLAQKYGLELITNTLSKK